MISDGVHLKRFTLFTLVIVAFMVLTSGPVGDKYSQNIPNPSKNSSISDATWNICVAGKADAGFQLDYYPDSFNQNSIVNTKACDQAVLRDINARHRAEGVPPMTLPSNFESLSPSMQVIYVVNAERVSRNLPPYVGVLNSLNADSLIAAKAGNDPNPSKHDGNWLVYNSIWAGGYQSALLADYDWMYNDGWGGNSDNTINVDCTSARAQGCWGHREGILATYDPSGGTILLAGAAVVTSGPSSLSVPSYAAAFEQVQTPIKVDKILGN